MRKLILFSLFLTVTLLVTRPVVAAPAPETLDDAALQRVAQSCHQAQVQLKALQKRDTILRINRGRLYDMTLRQTGAFVARLDVNKIDAPEVKQADGTIRAELQRFKEDYDRYDDMLGQTLASNCAEQPREFYSLLGQTAQLRRVVGEDVAKIKQGITEYSSSLTRLSEKTFPATTGTQP